MCGGIDIKPDDIAQLFDKMRIVRKLEPPPSMGAEPMRLPDAAHRAGGNARGFSHRVRGPVRDLARRVAMRERHNSVFDLRPERRNARGARLVAQKPVDAFLHEPLLPAPHTRLRHAGLAHDLGGSSAIVAQKHDLTTPHMLLRRVTVGGDRRHAPPIGRAYGKRDSCAHTEDSHTSRKMGIPKRTLSLDGHH